MMPPIWQLIGLMRGSPGLANMIMRHAPDPVVQIPKMPGGGVPGAPNPMGVAVRPGQGVMGGQGVPAPYNQPGMPVPYAGAGGGGAMIPPGGGGFMTPAGGPMVPGAAGPYAANVPPLTPGAGGPTMSLTPQTFAQMNGAGAMAGLGGAMPPPQGSPAPASSGGSNIPDYNTVSEGLRRLEDPNYTNGLPNQPMRFPPSRPDLPDPRSPSPNPAALYKDYDVRDNSPGEGKKWPDRPKGGGANVPMPPPRPKGLLGDQNNAQNDDLKKWLERNFWESVRIQNGMGSNR